MSLIQSARRYSGRTAPHRDALPPMLHLAAPEPDLDGVVECGIVVRQSAATSTSRFPAMPRAMITLTPGDGATAAAVHFHAVSTRPMAYAHGRPFEALGLVLPPATAARLMGPSTGALVDATLPWAELAGVAEAARLGDELHLAGGDSERLRTLQGSLRRVLARGPERVQHARAAALHRLCLAVGRQGARAASSLGVGERQLERRCRAWLGLAPKQLQRLTRFHAVLASAMRHQRLPGAETALAAGYYDQSHLAREALQLAGAPLRDLLSGAHEDGAWWPLATQRLPSAGGALRHHR
ncbi:MAG: AraC family transcriptional regulator [Rubrivivax sp.]|nr:AraC family transcriptional regulator [Rubrivivax sp.]